MIPKKIHYVWVGGKEKSADVKRCMATWQVHLKDYEIIEWNENNFDMNMNDYIKTAYEQKKWAYVSDFIRAYVIYHEGGIYLDTDVLVLDNLEQFLQNKAFVGFENPDYPFTAAFGAEQGHPFVKDMLNDFEGESFSFDKNDQMKNVNTKTVSDILIDKYHCQLGNQEQTLETGIHVYPSGILCNPSGNSSTIHVFTGTWMEGQKPLKRKINKWFKIRTTSKAKAKCYQKLLS
ncbi:glycosyltransferase family 32 protein [Latilactobacillus fuchuensis]|uniref:TcdA/TcdB catalytic glycosyltransferase domain protein n=2 Tax=Latilactobacillus fuchuensis TaxID=164393 RepID=A0A2N9DXA2_9LACO|nr:glycosyltransferase [Latilactobacillus fuchuensis]KRL59042.1 polysaccharide biosynthesis protein CpsM(V) [Latilactobacillus fuchuensis DSM 14340 = JCM 11249]SPC39306.1 TcdA/TcdB catalytic glycosyltransferase domain protein [Latilactobacillus fuchuensis]